MAGLTADPRSWQKEKVAAQAAPFSPDLWVPMRFFAFGLAALLIFGAALPFFTGEVLAQHHYTHRSVAFTHLLVLGSIASIVLGATYQLVPVALSVRLHSEKLARASFWFHASGTAGMVAGFWVWNFRVLAWAGTLVTLGLGLFIYNLVRTLRRVRRQDIVSIHVAVSLLYLALTFLAGQYLIHDKLMHFSPIHVVAAIHAHAHLAVLGWLALMIIGVGYRLIPMFALSSIRSEGRAWTAFGLLNAGIFGVFLGILSNSRWLTAAAVLASCGIGLWLVELSAIYRARRRAHLDTSLRQARWAAWQLVPAAAAGLWLSWPDAEPSLFKLQAQTGYFLVALLGFVGLFVLAMLHKIIPFLVWFRLHADKIGLAPTPKLYDLYSVRAQKAAGWIFLAGVWSAALASAFAGSLPAFALPAAAGILGLGILIFVSNLASVLLELARPADSRP